MEVQCEARVGAALLFIGTNRMLGRVTASQSASASVGSFLPCLRQALTPLGGTNRISWPSASIRAPNGAQLRASILIRHGARWAKHASKSIYCAEKLTSPRWPQSPIKGRSRSDIQRRDRRQSTHSRRPLSGQAVTRIPR